MKTTPQPPSNAHVAHPERGAVTCPWTKCGRLHIPYTKMAQQHRAKALREASLPVAVAAETLYAAILAAPDLRAARRISADLWRKHNG